MNASTTSLSLDQRAVYRVTVPGHFGTSLVEQWGEWITDPAWECGSQPCTTLTGLADQAALHGLLRRLYRRGVPLISVVCLDYQTGKAGEQNE